MHFTTVLILALLGHCALTEGTPDTTGDDQTQAGEQAPKVSTPEAGAGPLVEGELEYGKGSVCNYCEYCKYCELCDEECPCETGPGKPNCHMCKYCEYCPLCKVCDTTCQPGGVIDQVSSVIFSAMPKVDKTEVEKDLKGVEGWVRGRKDEL